MLKAESQRMVCLSSPVSLFVLSTKNSKVSCNAGASVVSHVRPVLLAVLYQAGAAA